MMGDTWRLNVNGLIRNARNTYFEKITFVLRLRKQNKQLYINPVSSYKFRLC